MKRALASLVCLLGWNASAQTVSPSAVLEKSDRTLGSQPVYYRYQPNGRVDADRTLAPYFHVVGGDPETDRLPLKETSAEVKIAGVIAEVKVRQVFANDGTKPIEAVYVFPASTRAAVHGMRMRIGERTIEAKIDRRESARESYEAARAQGRRASLLEQERPNVFTMSVANVMPKDRIQVELDYSELLVPEDGIYEFVYPTVVGPRYAGGADPEKDRWIASPYLTEGEKEPYGFDIGVHLETGIPIKEVSSPSHKVNVSFESPSSADVKLAESGGGNRDYVLRYRLAGDRIETGLLLYPGKSENFFALMMEPPRRPTQAQIPPREYIFVLDVSGSMHGFPLETAKELMRNLLTQLRPTDTFDLVFFSGANYLMSPQGSIPATPANIQSAIALVGHQNGSGGTELIGGLTAAYGVPRASRNVSRTVVVVTDGYVGVEAQAFKMVREHLGDANLFAFGIGSAVNRGLIEGLARAGQGEPFVVLDPAHAKAQADKLRAYIEQPVLTNIHLAFKGLDVSEVAPAKVPDLMARRPIVVFGKYKGEPSGTIELTGLGGAGTRIHETLDVARAHADGKNAPLVELWARKWVATLDDQVHMGGGKEVEEAITRLGLRYNLLTSYTSFVAVDSVVTNAGGHPEQVRQPLPLPQGVSNLAVGGAMGHAQAQTRSMPMRAYGGPAGGGYYGRSGGGGGKAAAAPMAPMAAETITSTPAPPPAKEAARKPRSAADEKNQEQPAPRLAIAHIEAHSLGDTRSLVGAIEMRLARAAGACGAAGELELRITVDASGRIIKVEGAPCLEKQLLGIVSATRPAGGATGTLELRLRLR